MLRGRVGFLGSRPTNSATDATMRGIFAEKSVAALAALVGWAGLALQVYLITGNLGAALGLWRFVGFFTTLTNLGVALVATGIALAVKSGVGRQRARLMAATSIVLVGIVYSVALRALWSPTGLQKVA